MSGARIPRQILASAKDGSLSTLWNLKEKISAENCTEDVIDAVFRHLKSELIPTLRDPDEQLYLDTARRGLACTRTVPTIAKACRGNSHLRSSLVVRVSRDIYDICVWSKFVLDAFATAPRLVIPGLLDLEHVFLEQADMFAALIQLDDVLLDNIIAERSFLMLLAYLWSGDMGNRRLAMRSYTPPGSPLLPCPIIFCVSETIRCDLGLELTFEIAKAGGSRRFIRGLNTRLRQLQGESRGGQNKVQGVPENVVGIVTIAARLVAQDAGLHLRLRKAGFFPQLIRTLLQVFRLITKNHPPSPPYRFAAINNLMDCMSAACSMLATSSSHVPETYTSMVDAGILPLVLQLATSVYNNGQQAVASAWFNEIFGALGAYIHFPGVLDVLDQAANHAEPNTKVSKTAGIYYLWIDFRQMLEDLAERFDAIAPAALVLCDNPSCDGNEGGSSERCSGCCSVFYCSAAFQKEDWVNRHRLECRLSRAEYSSRYSSGSLYSRTVRGRHAQVLAHWDDPDEEGSEREMPYGDHPLPPSNRWIRVFEFGWVKLNTRNRRLQLEGDVARLDDSKASWREDGELEWTVQFTQPYLVPRLSQLVADYLQDDGAGDRVRLVEASFPWGRGGRVFLVVRMVEQEDGTFKPSYCVHRYANIVDR